VTKEINPPEATEQDSYLQRLAKLIPVEITTAYVAIAAALTLDPNTTDPDKQDRYDGYLLCCFVVLLVLVPCYLWFLRNVRNNWAQIIVTTLSFPIWAATVSASVVQDHFPGAPPQLLAVILIVWTTILPLLVR
jgi:hypothetical protein